MAHQHSSIKPPKVDRRLPEHLNESEIRALLDTCRQGHEHPKRDFAIVLLMLDTGLRASELCGLALDNWDLDTLRIKVMGKGRKERYLSVSPLTAKALWDYQAREREKSPYKEMFLVREAMPMNPRALSLMLERRARQAGIRHVWPHLLRKTFAVEWCRAGGPINGLQALLGHSTAHMSMYYAAMHSTEAAALHREFSPVDRLNLRIREKRK